MTVIEAIRLKYKQASDNGAEYSVESQVEFEDRLLLSQPKGVNVILYINFGYATVRDLGTWLTFTITKNSLQLSKGTRGISKQNIAKTKRKILKVFNRKLTTEEIVKCEF